MKSYKSNKRNTRRMRTSQMKQQRESNSAAVAEIFNIICWCFSLNSLMSSFRLKHHFIFRFNHLQMLISRRYHLTYKVSLLTSLMNQFNFFNEIIKKNRLIKGTISRLSSRCRISLLLEQIMLFSNGFQYMSVSKQLRYFSKY